MSLRGCSMWGRPIEFPDSHSDCVLWLGYAHTKEVLKGCQVNTCQSNSSTQGWLLCLTAPRRLSRLVSVPSVSYGKNYLCPSPEARDLISFGCRDRDAMSTNASDAGAWSEALTEETNNPQPHWTQSSLTSSQRL